MKIIRKIRIEWAFLVMKMLYFAEKWYGDGWGLGAVTAVTPITAVGAVTAVGTIGAE
ncbi:MAG: hypothetical protein IK025_01370 [Bacteroidales bacterium]|nr:hypothetical protein [Bacteroidales bacterium]